MKIKGQLYLYRRQIKGIKGRVIWKILRLIDKNTVWDYCYEELDDFLDDYLNDCIADRYDSMRNY